MVNKIKKIWNNIKNNLIENYSIKKTVFYFLILPWLILGLFIFSLLSSYINEKNEIAVSLINNGIIPLFISYLIFVNFILVKKSLKLTNKFFKYLGTLIFGSLFVIFLIGLFLNLLGK